MELTEVGLRVPREFFERVDAGWLRDQIEAIGQRAREQAAEDDRRDSNELTRWADVFGRIGSRGSGLNVTRDS